MELRKQSCLGGAFRAPCLRRLVSADVRHLVRRSSLRRHPRCSPSSKPSLDNGDDRVQAIIERRLSQERLKAVVQSELQARRKKLEDDEALLKKLEDDEELLKNLEDHEALLKKLEDREALLKKLEDREGLSKVDSQEVKTAAEDYCKADTEAGAGPSSLGGGGLSTACQQPGEEIQSFWKALLGLDITVNSSLSLPSGVYLLGRVCWGSSLFVRPCYRGLFNRMMSLHSSNLNRRFLITGTPGIGKSFFAVVLMLWLVKEKDVSTIVYQCEEERCLFTAKGTDLNVEEGSITDFDKELKDPTAWWIVDMATPTRKPANTVLLSSPARERYKEFLKLRGATALYMPIWTDEEIEKCRLQLYPSLDDAMVRTLMSKWGNIPRYVLEKAMDEVAQSSLDDAITTCKWEDIMACIGMPDSAGDASHKLVHLEVVGDQYNKKVMMPASQYVAQQIVAKMGNGHMRLLKDLVHLSIGFPAYAAAAGVFFETYAHRRLQQGGSFQVRQLHPSKMKDPMDAEPFVLQQCSDIHVFHKLEEVEQHFNNTYYVPHVSNFPAVDALMQPNILLQMTIAQKAGVNESGLKAAAGRLLHKPARLYFVVPDNIFGAFRFVSGIPVDIEQWVLKLPWK
ncbi:hypothetical protein Vretimale_18118 [Volvox reticuliferus]|uniref:Uncharacterized protein n=1 Tax=Volvox reticuliferus TaxID=1737510 RepID=A0A8J4FXI6_9CHLO|nr:hypothetical protein Vretifemale_17757 [Volvox reticuliferus]GIM15275.1 hypothetical protein Vretimale_18118 [Volvox reticuliferus]